MQRTSEHLAESARQASCATSTIGDAFKDGVETLKRTAKHSGDAAEEFLNDTSQRLQRHPALTIATTFALGLTAGAMIGWTIRRRS
jgi:ElaB/YqjD/DUF883 family membrane-anchored ribosome-binding protein